MANYYNAMLTGADRNIRNCAEVYERLRGYNVFVIDSCGYGMDGTCNKRIKFTGDGGIGAVRSAFASVIATLEIELEYLVNSKPKCVF